LEAHTLKPESSNDALERKNLWTFRYTVAKKIKMKISKKIHETCAAEPSLHVQLRDILGKSAGRKSEEEIDLQ
jgi:hypothetical protein